jgi:mono/diheme cytochrome c family protein
MQTMKSNSIVNSTFIFRLILTISGFACTISALADDAVGKGLGLFQRNCAACHQVDGKGVHDVFPALAGNTFVQGSEKDVIAVVLNGRNGMPTFSKQLADQDLAAILSYVRTAWGNQGAAVSTEQVATVRGDLHADAYDPTQHNIRH